MGAKVGRNESQGWEVSVTDVDLTAEGKKLFDGKDTLVSSILSPLGIRLHLGCSIFTTMEAVLSEGVWDQSIYQMHKDIVFDYPPFPTVQPLGSTARCKVQGMFVPRRILTVQGHPEFTEEILVEILEVRHEQGVFGDEIYEEAMGRVGRGHDGLMVGRKFVEFLMER